MEVHRHTHFASGETHTPGPGLHRGRKKWTHYFWEFLMLFLAVFCGFLAEYQLEHTIEKNRERKYILSMLDDLKRDTNNFTARLKRSLSALGSGDTLISLLRPHIKKDQTAAIYYHARMISIKTTPFPIFDRTYSQMKSSGNLRLLHSRKVADSITSYYSNIDGFISQYHYVQQLVMEYFKNASVVFDGTVFQNMWYDSGFTSANSASYSSDSLKPPPGNPTLADTSERSINTLVNSIHFLHSRIYVVRTQMIDQVEDAIRLIIFLKEEYELKE